MCTGELFLPDGVVVVVAAKVTSTSVGWDIIVLGLYFRFAFSAFSGSIGAHDGSRGLFDNYVGAQFYWS